MSLAAPDFDYLCQVVRSDSAIVLEPGKEYLFESRLQPLLRREGVANLGELVRKLRLGSRELRAEVVDAMTTNETSFFRDGHPWQTLGDAIVPQLLAARPGQQLTIWCAACSSGQEPYSLAMVLRDRFPDACAAGRIRIVATDLSPSMLERCRLAAYSQLEVGRGVPMPMLAKWFVRKGINWVLHDDIRSMVELRTLNLADFVTWNSLPPQFDLALIRNVLIYFDPATKSRILTETHRRLRPSGALLLGSSETTLGLVDCYSREQSGPTIYYRPIQPGKG
jgi:chemotaxis protein methyltransferase CheR